MSTRQFRELLQARLSVSRIPISDEQTGKLERYFELLQQWSRRINLTGFELDPIGDQAIDRLFCEPLAAVSHIPLGAANWVDIGSGGGSPAVPIKVAIPSLPLTMVETRDRKCAFLREVSRELDLSQTSVLNSRFEDAVEQRMRRADVITLRAVRANPRLSHAIAQILQNGGVVLVFGAVKEPDWPDFTVGDTKLLEPTQSTLSILTRAFHVPRGTSEETC